eukprot:3156-Heterococcus_DN1.PRE.2
MQVIDAYTVQQCTQALLTASSINTCRAACSARVAAGTMRRASLVCSIGPVLGCLQEASSKKRE